MLSERVPRRQRVVVRSVLLVLFVLSSSTALAQQPSIRPYESEEDLWEALNDGEISFDEFIELLDLARSGDDSLLVPQSDWEALPGSDAGYLTTSDSAQSLTKTTATTPSRVDIPWISSARLGIDADLREPTGSDGYSVIRSQRGRWRSLLDFRHDREDGGTWRKRSLIWQPQNVSVVLGNFEPRWGRGLVVGRRSRVIRPSEVSGSFWQPVRGRFNGAWASTPAGRRISAQLFWTDLRGDSLIDRAIAARLEVGAHSRRIGLTGLGGGSLYDPDRIPSTQTRTIDYPRIVGLDYQSDFKRGQLLSEFAIDQNGATGKTAEFIWRLSKGQFHSRAWSYGSGFISPWGGGPGHADTRRLELYETGDYFSSRTAGERGFDFTTRIAATPTVKLRWDWMSHRDEPGALLEHSGVFRAEIKRPTLRTMPFVKARIEKDESESFSVGNYLWWGPDSRELNVRFEFGTHYNDEVQFIRAGFGAKLQINRIVRFAPALRWVDPNLDIPSDGYWYFYLTEAVVPIRGARIEMALVWKKYEDKGKDDLVEFRVRAYVE